MGPATRPGAGERLDKTPRSRARGRFAGVWFLVAFLCGNGAIINVMKVITVKQPE
jgi:hypothetical protein